MNFEQRVWKD